MANKTDYNHKQPLPILTKEKCPEWRRPTIGLLWQKILCSHCNKETLPSISADTQTAATDNKIINANIKACNIITNSLESSTFSELVIGDEEMYNSYLLWNKLTNCFASSMFNSEAGIWNRFSKIA
ncbi:hypothetical protein O181_003593 [Austropuccinia psidii MF-1]|uniref:Uncharacterized protein n=1 Tax=Austropuccinia psidii MF-1 TaxID=1389203 RepID=A0A9Q3BEQ4_9BASI|nr:hypothetical protein [Austropuccinia psidii MF-1]